MFEAHIRKTKADSLAPQDIRDWLKSVGRSAASASSFAAQAVKHGLVKRTGKSSRVRYTIIRKKS
jgi:hypothetical protein